MRGFLVLAILVFAGCAGIMKDPAALALEKPDPGTYRRYEITVTTNEGRFSHGFRVYYRLSERDGKTKACGYVIGLSRDNGTQRLAWNWFGTGDFSINGESLGSAGFLRPRTPAGNDFDTDANCVLLDKPWLPAYGAAHRVRITNNRDFVF